MNSVTRKDGTKEKQPELTASRIHNISPGVQITLEKKETNTTHSNNCLLYTSPSPRDRTRSRMPSSA